MTHKVRWDTEHEEDDVARLWKAVGDDFAIALDRNGWAIVMKPECREEGSEACKWRMLAPSDACPAWAIEDVTGERRQIAYKPYPSNLTEFLGPRLRRFLR